MKPSVSVPNSLFDPNDFPGRLKKALKTALRASFLGRPFHYFPETTSTNDIALEMAGEGAPEGALVLAGTQTRGRGRARRTWVSGPGAGLWFSIVLRPELGYPSSGMLPLAVGFGVVSGLRELGLATAGLKWPNDVLVGGPGAGRRKIAGILVEGRSAGERLVSAVAGIGVNWGTPDLEKPFYPVTGLAAEFTAAVPAPIPAPETVLVTLLDHVEKAYLVLRAAGSEPFRAAWPDFSAHFGRWVLVRDAAADQERTVLAGHLLPDGSLEVLSLDGGRERLVAAEVSLRLRKQSIGSRRITG